MPLVQPPLPDSLTPRKYRWIQRIYSIFGYSFYVRQIPDTLDPTKTVTVFSYYKVSND